MIRVLRLAVAAAFVGGVLAIASPSPAAPAAQLTLSPTGKSFGSVPLGTTKSQAFTVRNVSSSTVAFSVAVTNAAPSAPFSHTTTCGASLPAGGTCTVTATFAPTVLGSQSGAVVLDDGGAGASAPLAGIGLARVTTSPTSVNFGSTTLGKPSAPQTITVRNRTTSTLTVDTSTLSPQFETAGGTCVLDPGTPLAPLASCTVLVRFTGVASALGQTTGQLSVTYTDGTTATTTLRGALASSVGTNVPEVAEAAIGGTGATEVVITNRTAETINVAEPTVGGAPRFRSVGNNCGVNLAPDDSCSAFVSFQPTALGTVSTTVRIPYTDSLGTRTATVKIIGQTGDKSISVDRPSIDFGTVQSGTTSAPEEFTITNTGTGKVFIAFPVATGPFDFVGLGTCDGTLDEGESCTANVVFQPTAVGAATGTLPLINSGPTVTIDLSGEGSPVPQTTLAVTPSPEYFGEVVIGSSSTRTFRLENTGAATATIDFPVLAGPYDFELTGTTCTGVLLAGETCDLVLRFTPTAVDFNPGSVTFDGNFPQVVVNLDGTGIEAGAPIITASPSSVARGDLVVGSGPVTTTVTLTNSGTARATIIGYADDTLDGISIDLSDCFPTLLAGASCDAVVTVDPVKYGSVSWTYDIQFLYGYDTFFLPVSYVGVSGDCGSTPPESDEFPPSLPTVGAC